MFCLSLDLDSPVTPPPYFSQLQQKFFAGVVVQIINLGLEMHTFRNYRARWMLCKEHLQRLWLLLNFTVWQLDLVGSCTLGDLAEGVALGIQILIFTGVLDDLYELDMVYLTWYLLSIVMPFKCMTFTSVIFFYIQRPSCSDHSQEGYSWFRITKSKSYCCCKTSYYCCYRWWGSVHLGIK